MLKILGLGKISLILIPNILQVTFIFLKGHCHFNPYLPACGPEKLTVFALKLLLGVVLAYNLYHACLLWIFFTYVLCKIIAKNMNFSFKILHTFMHKWHKVLLFQRIIFLCSSPLSVSQMSVASSVGVVGLQQWAEPNACSPCVCPLREREVVHTRYKMIC